MQREAKQRADQLSRELYDRMATFEVANMIKLLELLIEDERANLMTCGRDQFERIQGKAQAYQTVLDRIKKPRPKLGTEE